MFAQNLKYLRTKNNMEQIELAQKLGRKSSSSISEWESGRYTPKIGILNDIAEIFQISIYDLMNTDLSNTSNAQMSDEENLIRFFSLLDTKRKKNVLSYTKKQLDEQNKVVTLNNDTSNDIPTLAAHRVDENHISSPEEIEDLHSFLDEIDKKYDEKHKDR